MEVGAEISINDIRERYGIKQSAAYKWRTALESLQLEKSWENYDKINNRQINLSKAAKGSAIAVATPSKVRQAKPAAVAAVPIETTSVEMGNTGTFGLSPGRVKELYNEAKLEVLVKSKFKDFHESELQLERSKELNSKIEEVKNLDPKNLGAMLSALGVT